MALRLVFAGTPEVALPSLEALLGSTHEVVAVITRPDAPAGRGRRTAASPVRERAQELGLSVLTPERPSDPQFLAELSRLAPDACPVVAYGALVPTAALEIPRLGWINLHFSLLPAWRGAAPVQHAVIAGDEVTGATTFLLEKGLDTGPVLGMMTEQIRPTDTSGDLLTRLADGGAGLLVATLDALEAGSLVPQPQSTEGISLAPKLDPVHARINWRQPAMAIDRVIRGCTPAPGAWSTFRGERIKLAPVALLDPRAGDEPIDPAIPPGELRVGKHEVLVGTGTGPVRLTRVGPVGKKEMPAADWARGARITAGERFEPEPEPESESESEPEHESESGSESGDTA